MADHGAEETTTAAGVLLFMRHGETEYNRRKVRCGGDVDIPLTELGEAQALEAGLSLRASGVSIDTIIASPLIRARRTAEIVRDAAGLACPIAFHDGLIERRLGDWNGMDIGATQPMLDAGERPPGGEDEPEFRRRIGLTLAEILEWGHALPLLVGSKGVARVLSLALAADQRGPARNAEVMRLGPPAEGWRDLLGI
ncbi:phosphoglycerate mutase [Skermanella stibiiresistens SB22]|uniref:Phosphoglycerate mutase n=1 Tax=Skermanella stibiiresistens SB22 TaxID=1385369 RepID=W9HD71_9PROT|nr:histidine phosphatase family protein [Skermanella stibiiresistens]EWY42622.1 phosphoglycerate mutase [Skermanella stibiiresistens SB22]